MHDAAVPHRKCQEGNPGTRDLMPLQAFNRAHIYVSISTCNDKKPLDIPASPRISSHAFATSAHVELFWEDPCLAPYSATEDVLGCLE